MIGIELANFFFQWIKFIESTSGGKGQRSACLSGGPNVRQSMQRILPRLQPEFIANRPRCRRLPSAESATLIPYDGLDSRKQFRRSHHANRHTSAAEDGFNHFTVVVAR